MPKKKIMKYESFFRIFLKHTIKSIFISWSKLLNVLKLPSSFNTFITNIFTNRKNSIFTEVGKTDPYDILIEIDQGEVILPLLWCIYYDLLLTEIESRGLGYCMLHSYKQNLYDNTRTQCEIHNATLAYIDDTTWITSN